METKWTPGTWVVVVDEWGYVDVVSKDDWVVCEKAGVDANLIAAAPDLYEALENLRFHYLRFVDPETDSIARAIIGVVDAALTKARRVSVMSEDQNTSREYKDDTVWAYTRADVEAAVKRALEGAADVAEVLDDPAPAIRALDPAQFIEEPKG